MKARVAIVLEVDIDTQYAAGVGSLDIFARARLMHLIRQEMAGSEYTILDHRIETLKEGD